MQFTVEPLHSGHNWDCLSSVLIKIKMHNPKIERIIIIYNFSQFSLIN